MIHEEVKMTNNHTRIEQKSKIISICQIVLVGESVLDPNEHTAIILNRRPISTASIQILIVDLQN